MRNGFFQDACAASAKSFIDILCKKAVKSSVLGGHSTKRMMSRYSCANVLTVFLSVQECTHTLSGDSGVLVHQHETDRLLSWSRLDPLTQSVSVLEALNKPERWER